VSCKKNIVTSAEDRPSLPSPHEVLDPREARAKQETQYLRRIDPHEFDSFYVQIEFPEAGQ
jgi:hypothetical protein